MNYPIEDFIAIRDRVDLSPLKGKSVLILGANGLLGAFIAQLFNYLNETKYYGIKLDLVTRSEIIPKSRISNLVDKVNIKTADLTKYKEYGKQYDFVLHAAGYASPSVFIQNPINVMDVNYIGMKSILENMPNANTLYLSSAEIYGSPTIFPTPETYPGNSPTISNRACYIESKRLTEVLCLTYRNRGYNVKIARPALTYGVGMTFEDERVISQFMMKAHTFNQIIMKNQGNDLRCFCYISDMVSQLMSIWLYGKEPIYNTGSAEEEITIYDLAKMIGEIMGSHIGVGEEDVNAIKNAPSRVKLDLTKVESEFGFKPQVKMQEGLEKTIKWAIHNA